MAHKLSIVVPVYNEERTIVSLLDCVGGFRSDDFATEIVVVDDGSTDASRSLVQDWIARRSDCDARLIVLPENGGKGAAVRAGIAATTGDAVIIQDADLEYDPNDYPACAMPIFRGERDVVYGSREEANRNRVYSSPGFYLGALSLTCWIDLLFHAQLTDEPTCYKTFRGDLIRALPFEENGFEWEPEITAKLLRLGFRIHETPIAYYPRSVKEGKKIRFIDGIRSFWIAFAWRFRSLRTIRARLADVHPSFRLAIENEILSAQAMFAVMAVVFAMRILFKSAFGGDFALTSLFDDFLFAASSGAAYLTARLFLPCAPAFLGVGAGFLAAVAATGDSAPGGLWLLLNLAILFLAEFSFGSFSLFLFSSVFCASCAAIFAQSCILWLPLAFAFLWANRTIPLHLKGFFSLFSAVVAGFVFCAAGFLPVSSELATELSARLATPERPACLLAALLLFAVWLWLRPESSRILRIFLPVLFVVETSFEFGLIPSSASAFHSSIVGSLALIFLVFPALFLIRTERTGSLLSAALLSLGFLAFAAPAAMPPLLCAFSAVRRSSD